MREAAVRATTKPEVSQLSWSRAGVVTKALASTALVSAVTLTALPATEIATPTTPAQVLSIPGAPLRAELQTVANWLTPIIAALPPETLGEALAGVDTNKVAQIIANVPPEKIAASLGAMDTGDVVKILNEVDNQTLSKIVSGLPDEKLFAVVGGLSNERLAAVVSSLPDDKLAAVVGSLSTDKLSQLVSTIPIDKLTEVVAGLPAETLTQLVSGIPEDKLKEVVGDIPLEKLGPVVASLPTEKLTALVGQIPIDKLTEVVAGLPTETLIKVVAGIPTDQLKEIVGGLPDDKLLGIADGALIQRVVALVIGNLATPQGWTNLPGILGGALVGAGQGAANLVPNALGMIPVVGPVLQETAKIVINGFVVPATQFAQAVLTPVFNLISTVISLPGQFLGPVLGSNPMTSLFVGLSTALTPSAAPEGTSASADTLSAAVDGQAQTASLQTAGDLLTGGENDADENVAGEKAGGETDVAGVDQLATDDGVADADAEGGIEQGGEVADTTGSADKKGAPQQNSPAPAESNAEGDLVPGADTYGKHAAPVDSGSGGGATNQADEVAAATGSSAEDGAA